MWCPELEKYKLIMKNKALVDLDYFKSNNLNINPDIIIFINTSISSNGVVNFMKDLNNYKNKVIKIYLFKQNNVIEDFINIKLTDININKLINILGHIDLAYCSGYKDIILDYIKVNNINDFIIYY